MTRLFSRATLSHGTVETKDLAASRRFYEDFLGLDVVQPSLLAIYASAGGSWKIACVRTGRKLREQRRDNRFSLYVPAADIVREAHALAVQERDTFAIRVIDSPVEREGEYSFLLQDLNKTWWEVLNRPVPTAWPQMIAPAVQAT